jgi:hypothetical protein
MPAEMNKERKEVPPNKTLSDMDKAYMVINYPRISPHADAPQWTVAHALEVAGVDQSTSQSILGLMTLKNDSVPAGEIRNQFVRYQLSQRKTRPGTTPPRRRGSAEPGPEAGAKPRRAAGAHSPAPRSA